MLGVANTRPSRLRVELAQKVYFAVIWMMRGFHSHRNPDCRYSGRGWPFEPGSMGDQRAEVGGLEVTLDVASPHWVHR